MPDLDAVVRTAASALTAREARGPVLVGLSGGADSQALLHLLRGWAAARVELHAIHVDHGLRPDSAADAARVAALCQEWRVPLVVERVAIDQRDAGRLGGIEHAARRERYRAFAADAARLGATVLALGHQRDDQAETVLLHLLRGAGLPGLRGMAVVARSGTVLDEFAPDPTSRPALWRPLLEVSRDEIEVYCRHHGLQPLLDPTNDDLALRRNAVRHAILPALEAHFPQARASLARAARLLADEDAALEAVAADHWERLVRWRDGIATVDRAGFRAELPAIQRRLLRRAWDRARTGPVELPADVVELARRQVTGGRTGSRLALPGGVCCLLDAGEAHIGPGENLEERLSGLLGVPLVEEGWRPQLVGADGAGAIDLPGGWRIEISRPLSGGARPADAAGEGAGLTLHIRGDLLADAGGRLVLRTWEDGDWVALPGGRGRQKLQDWFVNRRVPRYARRRFVLVAVGKRVLWVAGLGTFLPEPKGSGGTAGGGQGKSLFLRLHRASSARSGTGNRRGTPAQGDISHVASKGNGAVGRGGVVLTANVSEVLLDERRIQDRVRELGKEISRDYAGQRVIFVGILRGAVIFLADLVRALDAPAMIDFMAVSSYGKSTTSSGVVRISKDLNDSIEGEHVLVVEDIIDSGLTLKYLVDLLRRRNPASLRVCTLLLKDRPREHAVALDYVGFTIPDEFVVGYGLDYAGYYRNLPYIGVLAPEAIEAGEPVR